MKKIKGQRMWAINDVCKKCQHYDVQNLEGKLPVNLPFCTTDFRGHCLVILDNFEDTDHILQAEKWWKTHNKLNSLALQDCPYKLEQMIHQPEGQELKETKKAWNNPRKTYEEDKHTPK